MISFDNSFFLDPSFLNLNNDKIFIENLKRSEEKSNALINEFKTNENEILQSFTGSYQSKIRNIRQSIKLKNKKKVVIGLGGSSSGAKALSFFLNDDIVYFDNFLIKKGISFVNSDAAKFLSNFIAD